jgi:hypothetical protein
MPHIGSTGCPDSSFRVHKRQTISDSRNDHSSVPHQHVRQGPQVGLRLIAVPVPMKSFF